MRQGGWKGRGEEARREEGRKGILIDPVRGPEDSRTLTRQGGKEGGGEEGILIDPARGPED